MSGGDYGLFGKSLDQVSPEELSRFLAQKLEEGERLEYKEALIDGIKLAKSIAAMVNADGGLLVVGVGTIGTKPTTFAGIPSTPHLEDTVLNWVSAHLRPRPTLEVRQIPKLNEATKSYLLIRVPWSDDTPCEVVRWTDGEPLIPVRIGSDIRRASLAEVSALMGRRLSPEKEKDLVETAIREFPFADLRPPGTQTQVPALHFFFVPLTNRLMIDMTMETDFQIAEAARFFGPFIEVAPDAFVREKLFGQKTLPLLPRAKYSQDSVELKLSDYERDMPRATCVKVTSTGGSYIGGLLGTDVVAFHRLIGYAMGSLKLAKWLLDKGSHHGKSFFRIILLDVGNRVLDFGFGKPPTIQLDGGCSIEKTASYEQLENHSLMVTEISRRFLREFQIQLTDEQIGEFVSSYEGIRELT